VLPAARRQSRQHNRLDPVELTAIDFASRLAVDQINSQVLSTLVGEGQRLARLPAMSSPRQVRPPPRSTLAANARHRTISPHWRPSTAASINSTSPCDRPHSWRTGSADWKSGARRSGRPATNDVGVAAQRRRRGSRCYRR
jgi:hypothetical protein